jgi:hypothetical protein
MMTTKAVFTLCVNNYSPEVTRLTFPFLRAYAGKIRADFHVIERRVFEGFPAVYEKLQIYRLGQDYDWNIYFDADTLVHPDLFDVTEHLRPDTVLHWGHDMAGNRWRYDHYFRRDGRHIGSGNWFTVASNWCLDLWQPLHDLSLGEAVGNIFPTVQERNLGIRPEHLLDDYVLSRNIARYGLKFLRFQELQKDLGREGEVYFFHNYLLPVEDKSRQIEAHIAAWGLNGPVDKKRVLQAESSNGSGPVLVRS